MAYHCWREYQLASGSTVSGFESQEWPLFTWYSIRRRDHKIILSSESRSSVPVVVLRVRKAELNFKRGLIRHDLDPLYKFKVLTLTSIENINQLQISLVIMSWCHDVSMAPWSETIHLVATGVGWVGGAAGGIYPHWCGVNASGWSVQPSPHSTQPTITPCPNHS